ncbi:MAG: lipoyl(octanoyl) transferase LipB [Deltaproteobacteria bacterium]|nr:lipoyl(octanoyl) transferase LipB [Deltaproteobacteria bacterium]
MPDQRLDYLRILYVGTLDYEQALRVQELTHQAVTTSQAPPTIIVVQHHPVLTLGKHADHKFLKLALSAFKDLGVDVVQTDRGGEVTAHMPGQLVLYPIIRLATFKLTPRSWVEVLEQSVIEALAQFGISAATDPINPGVWVKNQKICAIGIRIKDRTSVHGIALNVSNNLELFDKIVPCGIPDRGVTSMANCLEKVPTLAETASVLLDILSGMLLSRARV